MPSLEFPDPYPHVLIYDDLPRCPECNDFLDEAFQCDRCRLQLIELEPIEPPFDDDTEEPA